MTYDVSIPADRGADKRWLAERHEYTHPYRAIPQGDFFESDRSTIVCPVCGDEYQYPGHPYVVPGNDAYEAGWDGRGDLTVLPFWGECHHCWSLCFGFHKGITYTFVAVPQ